MSQANGDQLTETRGQIICQVPPKDIQSAARLAQSVEHETPNLRVMDSSSMLGANVELVNTHRGKFCSSCRLGGQGLKLSGKEKGGEMQAQRTGRT